MRNRQAARRSRSWALPKLPAFAPRTWAVHWHRSPHHIKIKINALDYVPRETSPDLPIAPMLPCTLPFVENAVELWSIGPFAHQSPYPRTPIYSNTARARCRVFSSPST